MRLLAAGFEKAEDRWRRLPDLPTPRHGMAAAAVGGRVYASGGSPVADSAFSIASAFLDVG